MKSNILSLSFFFIISITQAQIPNIDWKKCYGGTKIDGFESIKQTSDGGYIMLGTTQSSDGDVTMIHGSANDYDIWVVKIGSNGTIDWEKSIGGTNQDFGADIEITSDGGYIIAGRTYSSNGDSTFLYGGQDAWIIKITETGNISWQKTYGGNGADFAYDIIQTADGGYIFAGAVGSSGGIVTNFMGYRDGWVVKITNNGTLEWQKTLGGTQEDYAYKIFETNEGYIVGCETFSGNNQVTGNHGGNDFWLVKLNTLGTIQWEKCYGGTYSEKLTDFITTTDNGYLLVGSASGNNGDVSGYHNPGTGNFGIKNDYLAIKINSLGEIIWQKCYGGSDNEMARSVINTPDGGYLILGYSDSNNGDNDSYYTFNGWDYWAIKTDVLGNIEWQETYGGSQEDTGLELINTFDGGILLAGNTKSTDQHVQGNHGLTDIWLVKFLNFQLGNQDYEDIKVEIVPNPANELIYITTKINILSKIIIYDTTGKKVLETDHKNGIIDVSSLNNNFYLLQLIDEKNNQIITKFFKK